MAFVGLCAVYVRDGNGPSFRFLGQWCSLAASCGFAHTASSIPQVAEFVDERPEEVKQMEAFRSSTKWKLLGGEFQQ